MWRGRPRPLAKGCGSSALANLSSSQHPRRCIYCRLKFQSKQEACAHLWAGLSTHDLIQLRRLCLGSRVESFRVCPSSYLPRSCKPHYLLSLRGVSMVPAAPKASRSTIVIAHSTLAVALMRLQTLQEPRACVRPLLSMYDLAS